MHRRTFNLYPKTSGAVNPITGRYEPGAYSDTPVVCEGVFEALPRKKTLDATLEGEHVKSEMRLLTTPDLLAAGTEIHLKDKIVYDSVVYFVSEIKDERFYGNFLDIRLTKEEGNV
jgi:hypothetical protein